jgi:DNA-binding MarR family transcriptional regulator
MPGPDIVNQGVNSEQLVRRLVDAMTRAYNRLSQVAESAHRDEQLTTGGRAVLLALEEIGPASIADLARARQVSRQFMQRLVASLVARGWLVEQPNPRRRRSSVFTPSAAGAALIKRIHVAEAPWWRAMSERFDPDELATACRVLARFGDPSPDGGGRPRSGE